MSHTHTIYVPIADTEIEVEVSFTRSPDIAEQGPSYASGGQPAEGGEVEIEDATVLIGKMQYPAPIWLLAIISGHDGLMEKLSDSLPDDDEDYDADAARDLRREEAA